MGLLTLVSAFCGLIIVAQIANQSGAMRRHREKCLRLKTYIAEKGLPAEYAMDCMDSYYETTENILERESKIVNTPKEREAELYSARTDDWALKKNKWKSFMVRNCEGQNCGQGISETVADALAQEIEQE